MTDAYERRPTAADISVGDTGPELVVEELEREDFVRYAGASGDFNPIHYDEPYARNAGNESVFAQGMLTAGFVSHMISDWFGLDRIERFTVRFQERVFPDDTIAVTGEITDVTAGDEDVTVTADLEAKTDGGDVVLSGEAVARLPSE
ncbi:MaoC/PaaZ C-terminal domain-containing protein [Natrialba sp. PRR66]|uniref:MaoC family dehydratase n=1 Tax=Natrialba sp. PRR66 TaxID=3098146 RepID=UPI002B1DF0E4|nr:MaoC/PaaZ C-terminal domain-containing protein [Natrialba sp. PRR66]